MCEVRIERFRPELHAAGRNLLNLFAKGQSGAPYIPERIRTYGFLAIFVDALGPFVANALVPGLTARLICENVMGLCCSPEHVEIMHVAQQILQMFQIVRPCFVLSGKKVLDDVPEPLNADTQGVERDLRPVSQCSRV